MSKVSVEWDIYAVNVDPKIVSDVRGFLDKAAADAIEADDPEVFHDAALKFASFGAADTEPRAQFHELWESVRADKA